MQARGSFAIDPIDGRVVETVLELLGVARITVVYAVDPRLQISVPVKMTEAYVLTDEKLNAVATYSNYRKFERAYASFRGSTRVEWYERQAKCARGWPRTAGSRRARLRGGVQRCRPASRGGPSP